MSLTKGRGTAATAAADAQMMVASGAMSSGKRREVSVTSSAWGGPSVNALRQIARLRPLSDPDALKAAIINALTAELGELDRIKQLPGFPRAAAATLSKAWMAGLNLPELAASADPEGAPRLAAVARLEAEVIRHLPPAMCRPADLVSATLARTSHAPTLFGRIAIRGHTEMSPVWRPLLAALATKTEVSWIAGPRYVPPWVRELGISVVEAPPETPEISAESCASPRHEALEALRWAHELIASRRARPEEIAIAAASPEEWDDHFLALSAISGLDLHFVYGRKVLTTPDGQLAAAVAEVLLRGFSHTRMVRLASLLRTHGKILTTLPSDWARALPTEAPLLDAARWRQVLSTFTPDSFRDGGHHAPELRELVELLARGINQAAEIGELLRWAVKNLRPNAQRLPRSAGLAAHGGFLSPLALFRGASRGGNG
jgi:hypothetical protein